MKTIRVTALIIALASLAACSVNSTRLNDPKEIASARKIADDFYRTRLEQGDQFSYAFFADTFYTATSKEELQEYYAYTEKCLGKLKKTHYMTGECEIVSGTDPRSLYTLVYENKYDSAMASEVITMTKENGHIRIMNYKVNSKAFMK